MSAPTDQPIAYGQAGRSFAQAAGSGSVEWQYRLQGGRCFWCQAFTLPQNLTREHLYPRRNKQRQTKGGAWVLAHELCNKARGALNIGSPRFAKWLHRVMRGEVRHFERRDHWKRKTPNARGELPALTTKKGTI